jgi:hypothetical protein
MAGDRDEKSVEREFIGHSETDLRLLFSTQEVLSAFQVRILKGKRGFRA